MAIASRGRSRAEAVASAVGPAASVSVASTTGPRWPIPPGLRRALLTFHIVVSVGLLGDSAGFLAVAIRAGATPDPDLAATSYDLLEMFSLVFGIPLSFAALISGLILGFGTRWGVARQAWTTAKLLLILSVILVGSFVIGPAQSAVRAGSEGASTALALAGAWDVLALSLATGLSVYKPRWRLTRRTAGSPRLRRRPGPRRARDR